MNDTREIFPSCCKLVALSDKPLVLVVCIGITTRLHFTVHFRRLSSISTLQQLLLKLQTRMHVKNVLKLFAFEIFSIFIKFHDEAMITRMNGHDSA